MVLGQQECQHYQDPGNSFCTCQSERIEVGIHFWMVLHFDVIKLWCLLKRIGGSLIHLEFTMWLSVVAINVVECFIHIRYCYAITGLCNTI